MNVLDLLDADPAQVFATIKADASLRAMQDLLYYVNRALRDYPIDAKLLAFKANVEMEIALTE